jgi:site-specific DNA-adenine methylase
MSIQGCKRSPCYIKNNDHNHNGKHKAIVFMDPPYIPTMAAYKTIRHCLPMFHFTQIVLGK